MWCADCQQDVPAVARSASEPLICPRCQNQLGKHELGGSTVASPSDAGIALDSFDRGLAEAEHELTAPRDWFEQEPTRQRLREIDRMLHSPYREASANPTAPATQRGWPELPSPPVTMSETIPLRAVTRRATAEPKGAKTSWLLSLMLGGGVIGFCLGVGLLAWSVAFQVPQLWQYGMTLTIGSEGLLILSLTWMAARLWRNGRRVNRQLHGVDQQLAEMQQFTGSLAGSQLASSQHYYHHFSQAASPHLLVANLRGQVDQLASRIGG